jgi:hypothetical protein
MRSASTERFWLAAAMVCAVGLVLLVLRARAPAPPPTADQAVIELYTIRATRLELNVGAYSRFGWNHPGPFFFYLAAPLYVASGRRFAAIETTALVMNVLSLATVGALLMKQAGDGFALGVMAGLGVYVIRFGQLLTSAWNPYVAILPLALLIVASAACAAGRLALLPLITVAACYVIQAHVAFLLPAAACVGGAVILFAIAGPGDSHGRLAQLARQLALSALIGATLWVPPLVDQIAQSGSRNMSQLTRFFLAPEGPRHSLRESAAIFGHEFTAVLQPGYAATEVWIHSVDRSTKSSRGWRTIAGVELVLLLATAWMARLRGRVFEASCALLCVATSVAAFAGIMQIRGPIDHYLVLWTSVIGALSVGILAGTAFSWLASTITMHPRLLRGSAVLLTAIIAAGAMVTGARLILGERAESQETAAVRTLTEAALHYLVPERTGKPVVHIEQDVWPVAAGLVLQLYKHDRRVAVERDWVSMFGSPFSANGGEIPLMVAGQRFHDEAAARTGKETILLGGENGVYLYALSAPGHQDGIGR